MQAFKESEASINPEPFFYSDLFELGYEAVGELDSRLEVVEDWKKEFREGVLYYLEMQRLRGLLLWNTWGQVDSARALIAGKGTFTPQSLIRVNETSIMSWKRNHSPAIRFRKTVVSSKYASSK